jgi:hypothetical protein
MNLASASKTNNVLDELSSMADDSIDMREESSLQSSASGGMFLLLIFMSIFQRIHRRRAKAQFLAVLMVLTCLVRLQSCSNMNGLQISLNQITILFKNNWQISCLSSRLSENIHTLSVG